MVSKYCEILLNYIQTETCSGLEINENESVWELWEKNKI